LRASRRPFDRAASPAYAVRMRNVIPAAITMIAYGLAVLFVGGLT
jgi:hypothetical protein